MLALVLAVVLSFTYVPSGAQAWDDPTLGGGTAWTPWHRWTTVLWMLAAGASIVTLVVLTVVSDATRRGAVTALGCAVVTGIATVVALATRGLVQWDQLALWAVAVGGGLDGYWPALDDGVRFVLIEGTEVDPGDYGAAVAVHLLAHAVGVAAAAGTLALVVRRWRLSPASDPAVE
ncbi:MAG TPA: hypothetical protein VLR27_00975 [Acidimicrobiales bacterium]|nr:hypothetical protein [Acidimicrobiales bacterium]